MKIVLASALFPPDIAPPAPYVKELAVRLAKRHDVALVVYGDLPEEVPSATLYTTSKRRPLVSRLAAYTFALRRAAQQADVLLVENGPSVELPALIVSYLCRSSVVLIRGDKAAMGSHPLLERLLTKRASAVVDDTPSERPEILPFKPRPDDALNEWERAWQKHISTLEHLVSHEQN